MQVSRICLGTNMLSSYVDEAAGATLIETFLDCGGNFIDTADIYSKGGSEEVIGKAFKGMKGRRQDAIIATKLSSPMGEGPNDRGNSRMHITASAEASLKRLQTDYIDLYILHYWDPQTPLEETLRAMDDLVRQGKVRYIGVSNFTAWQVVKAQWVGERMGLDPIRSVQLEYNFLDRGAEQELFPMCQEQGLTITPYWVLQAGMFTGKYQRGKEPPQGTRMEARPGMRQRWMSDPMFDIAEKVQAVAKKAGHTPTEVSLAWALSKPPIGSVIAGTSRPEQVKANCEAVDIELSPEVLAELDATDA